MTDPAAAPHGLRTLSDYPPSKKKKKKKKTSQAACGYGSPALQGRPSPSPFRLFFSFFFFFSAYFSFLSSPPPLFFFFFFFVSVLLFYLLVFSFRVLWCFWGHSLLSWFFDGFLFCFFFLLFFFFAFFFFFLLLREIFVKMSRHSGEKGRERLLVREVIGLRLQ